MVTIKQQNSRKKSVKKTKSIKKIKNTKNTTNITRPKPNNYIHIKSYKHEIKNHRN